MFLAIAALLIQPQIAAGLSISAEKMVPARPAVSATVESAPVVPETAPANTAVETTAANAALPDAPVPVSAVNSSAPAALILVKPSKPMTVSVGELLAENRDKQRLWKGLAIASSGAATFDAWTTRHAITTTGAQELNPLLKPFAGNSSLYAAIQVGPVLMDYVGKKMMYSRHSLVRHMWWAPQSVSFVSSLFCGAHNLSFH